MRIVHWYPNFLGGGGVATAVAGLALAQRDAGAEVRIAAADEGAVPLYGGLHDAHELLLSWQPTWKRAVGPLVVRGLPRSVRDELRSFAPDIVHIHGEFNPDNLWTRRLAPAVLVLSPHGAFDPVVFAKSRRRLKRGYVALARRLLYERLAAFHALSPREESHVRGVVPTASPYVVPQGGGPVGDVASLEAHSPDAQTELVFVGRVDVYTKGLDLLLAALARVVARGVAVHLTLVGPDWRGGRQQVEGLVARLGLENAVTLTGELAPPEVAARIDRADCAVLVSRHEGFPLSATEALIRGKPLVLSRETGQASYQEIASAEHVLIVAPEVGEIEHALLRVSDERARLLEQAASARTHLAAFFSWRRAARSHLDNYRAVLELSAPD
jgi:glycosyltransferase involved in cell wall biosynthesis